MSTRTARPLALVAALSTAALLAITSTAYAQPAGPIKDASVDELRSLLLGETPSDEPVTKGFRPAGLPSTNGLCPAPDNTPGAAPERQAGTGGGGATGRNFVVVAVPYAPANPGVQMALEFRHASDELGAPEQRLLQKLASAMRDPRLASRRYAVAGHTDATGDATINLRLSCARALAVKRFLIGQGVPGERLSAYGFGSSKPIELGVAESARNRRVEVRTADGA